MRRFVCGAALLLLSVLLPALPGLAEEDRPSRVEIAAEHFGSRFLVQVPAAYAKESSAAGRVSTFMDLLELKPAPPQRFPASRLRRAPGDALQQAALPPRHRCRNAETSKRLGMQNHAPGIPLRAGEPSDGPRHRRGLRSRLQHS